MPRCQGLPDGPCPKQRNDGTVKVGEGDLLLCKSCDETRFRQYLASRPASSSSSSAAPSDSSAQSAAKKPNKSLKNQCAASAPATTTTTTTTTTITATAGADGAGQSGTVSDNDNSPSLLAADVKVNELLSYVSYYRDRASVESIRKVLLGFYSAAEINTAKKLLVSSFAVSLTDCPLRAERRKSATRDVFEAEVDDIIGIFDYIDQSFQSALNSVIFAATDFDRVPKYGPEELNICAVVDKQCETEARLDSLTSQISQIQADQPAVLQRIESQISQLSDVCVKLGESVNQQAVRAAATPVAMAPTVNNVPVAQSDAVDRSRNIVVFGLEDTRETSTTWRETLVQVLDTACGRHVELMDAFRLGKTATPGKCRPVLVKLHSAWDRRTLISGSWKLSTVDEFQGVFIAADLPLAARRRKVMDRLVHKSTTQGRQVSVSDGVVTVDGQIVFSLDSGYVRDNV